MASDINDRRSEARLQEQATIFLEVASADYENQSPPTIIICNSLDISANGIQVQMDEQVPVGSILRLCAEFSGDRQPLYLVGEAKWVRREDDQYNIGFELFDAEHTDIIGWKQLIATILSEE